MEGRTTVDLKFPHFVAPGGGVANIVPRRQRATAKPVVVTAQRRLARISASRATALPASPQASD